MNQESLIISPHLIARRCISPINTCKTLFECQPFNITLPEIVNVVNHKQINNIKLSQNQEESKELAKRQLFCNQLNSNVRKRCLKLVRSSKAQNRYLFEARGRLKKKLLVVSHSKERVNMFLNSIPCLQKERIIENQNICVQRAITREKVLRNLNFTLNDHNLTHKVFELGTTMQNWRHRAENIA